MATYADWNRPSAATSGTSLNFGGMFSGDDDNDATDGSSSVLPLFSNGISPTSMGLPSDLGWTNIKSNLEAQMPQQILGMNYQQRFKVFVSLLLLSGLFFGLGFTVGLTTLTIRPQKFALCFTLGSLTFMGSFAILRGPSAHLAGMVAPDRLPFTLVYVASMAATLYLTCNKGGVQGYLSVLIASGFQLVALLWYLAAFLPGGSQGMKVLLSAMMAALRPMIMVFTSCIGMIVRKCIGGE